MPTGQNITLCSPRPSSGRNPRTLDILTSEKPLQCPENHILIKVEKFGFSANNITYQALGEHPHFRYFEFHDVPHTPKDEITSKTHGLIPVWGFGTVVDSNHPRVPNGERVYGYFTLAQYILVPVSSASVNRYSFYVPRPHLPADRRPYNQITRCNADPLYDPNPLTEDLTMLYRPLFWTSYWCEDWLHESGYRGGVSSILISSASSKTAFCLAYLIKKRKRHGGLNKSTKVIGLTSKRNMGFTERLGLYDVVLDYDSFASTSELRGRHQNKWIYVDVSGNDGLNQQIRTHFTSPYTGTVVAYVELGMTNISPSTDVKSKEWSAKPLSATFLADEPQSTSTMWPKVEQFFMPEWLDVRRHQLSIQEITSRQAHAWKELMGDCISWVELQRVYGPDSVKNAYDRLSKEGMGPDKGLIWSLWNNTGLKASL